MSNYFLGIVLGVVQGISEWLPISSKTQIIIVSTYFFGLSFPDAYALGLFLEIGTFVAAVIYFRKEVWRVILALFGKGDEESRLLLKFLLVVTAVTGVVGVILYKLVSETYTGPALGIPMIALGIVLIGDGLLIRFSKKPRTLVRGLRDLRIRDMLLIGLAQGIAALPGVSRSGATVSTMLLLGVKPGESFRLSFLALIPASVGAALVTVLLTNQSVGSVVGILTPPVLVIAIVVTMIVGIVSIRVLLRAAGSNRISLLTISLGVLAIFGGLASILYGAG